jgi:hypothetical protein
VSLGRKASHSAQFVSSVWTFDDERAADGLYRWYGTLPQGLIRRLLELYCDTDDARVADPFAGAGNVLLAARGLGIAADGMDANPLAVLLARARISEQPTSGQLASAWAAAQARLDEANFRRAARRRLKAALARGDFEYSRRWFREDTLDRLWLVGSAISTGVGDQTMGLLLVQLASTVRDVANVDPRCTHHLVTKVKPFLDAADLLQARVSDYTPKESPQGTPGNASVQQGDALSWVPTVPYDLTIVHPPYLGVIHYNWIHRLATDLLGLLKHAYSPPALEDLSFDHEDLRERDMSTDKSDRYDGFVQRLSDVLEKAAGDTGRLSVIIGDQRYKGMLRHPFTTYIAALEDRGFVLQENFIWVLQNNGGMHVLRRGHFIDHNYVLVFARA